MTGEGWPFAPAYDDPQDVAVVDDEIEAALAFNRAVSAETHRLRVREAAGQIMRQERVNALTAPPVTLLTDFLAVHDEPQLYRVDGLLPVGGRALLAAQYKAGKTTLRDNLLRALADEEPFLDSYAVDYPAGRVVLFDDELDERMLRRWLRDQNVRHPERVAVVSLRGWTATFDLLDEQVRAYWAGQLRALGASVVVLDCLRPVLDALGLSEDKDAGRFLVALDALLAEASVSEAVVVHHMGHAGERSRGDSRLRDWPDAEWRLVRQKGEEGEEQQPDAPRFFSAYGRDVDVPEGLLEYDPSTRHLSMAGGSRRDAAADAVIPAVLAHLAEHPGLSGRQIESALVPLAGTQKDVRQAVKRAVHNGSVTVVPGPRRADLHYLATTQRVSASSALPVRQRTESECVSASIGDALTRTDAQGSSASPQRTDPAGLTCRLCGGPLDELWFGAGAHPGCQPTP